MKKKVDESYFRMLEVAVSSTNKEIKRAFRQLIKKWHPDRFPNDDEAKIAATERSRALIEAYEALKDYEPDFNVVDTKTEILRVRVKSSNIHSVGYDNVNMILEIVFLNGGIYKYYNVPSKIYDELLNAPSKGRYANRNIFYSYEYTRIR